MKNASKKHCYFGHAHFVHEKYKKKLRTAQKSVSICIQIQDILFYLHYSFETSKKFFCHTLTFCLH